ncbi:head maturation protease, ClpP-related [Salinicoccus roseus]|uniref:head maturation protease, ClpP-related n=1 Tax=Salinicoccus roseus TaxID=45670 RepID=UPI0022FFEF23|nr:head maturation protease, ClpP-related [Salinicoccus roseus]
MKREQLIKNGMKYEFKNEVQSDTHILTLSGVVAKPDLWDMIMENETINAQDIASALDDVETDILVRINSGGGDVFEGIEIYNYLKNHPSKVTVEVTAVAASAASIITMAGDEVIMDTGSSLMIHEASTFAWGNKGELKKAINALETIDGSLADIYNERTGIDKAELDELLTGETWFTADEAVEKGFADRKSSRRAPEMVETPEEEENFEAAIGSGQFDELKEMFNTLKADIDAMKEQPNENPKPKEPQAKSGFGRFLF